MCPTLPCATVDQRPRERLKMARVTINRDYLLTINGNGKSRYITDHKLRGFCIKVSPTGSVAFYYRWDKPRTAEGKRQQGSKFIANWPGTEPGKARDMAAKFAATVEHSTTLAFIVVEPFTRKPERIERQVRCAVLACDVGQCHRYIERERV